MTKTPVGYPEGGKKYKGAPKNFGTDPRSTIVTNEMAPGSKIDKGTKVSVKSKTRKPITATWF